MSEMLLFDLIESEAEVNVFLDRPKENFRAKGAAIIITSSTVGHFPKKRGDRYTIWFGRGIERWTYKTFKEATAKVVELLKRIAEVKPEINFRFEGKDVKKFNRFSAEITKVSEVES